MRMSYFENGKWASIPPDFTLNKFPCHREILLDIEYFRTLLNSSYRENLENKITITNFSDFIIEKVLSYVYNPVDYLPFFNSLNFKEFLELYNIAEFLLYTKLITVCHNSIKNVHLELSDVPLLISHCLIEKDDQAKTDFINVFIREINYFMINVSDWPREFIQMIIDKATDQPIKLYLTLRWIACRANSLSYHHMMVLLRPINLVNIGKSQHHLHMSIFEVLYKINQPQLTLTVSRELISGMVDHKHKIIGDWDGLDISRVSFSPIFQVRDNLHRITIHYYMNIIHQSLILILPELELTSIKPNVDKTGFTLRLEFPRELTYIQKMCVDKLNQLENLCLNYVSTLNDSCLDPFRENFNSHLIGIVMESRGQFYILVRTKHDTIIHECNMSSISLYSLKLPCRIQAHVKFSISISKTLSITKNLDTGYIRYIE